MDGGQSISFTSFDSYNYPSHHNLTFHQYEPTSSRHELAKDSTIRHFPGKQVNLGQNLEIMVLLQTAEIERLTVNLHEYRMKFKRILNNEKDYNSFKNQADELLQVKDELELQNKKFYQFVENQKGELMDQSKYVKVLENKYKRALKIIEEAHMAKQQSEQINAQLKEQILTMQKTFESFKQKSIEEYQRLRDELQKAKNEQLSFEVSKYSNERQRWGQILKKQQTKFLLERQKYESLLEQQRNRMSFSVNEIERWKSQASQNKKYIEQITMNQKRVEQQKDNHLVLLGTEVQRLNVVLKDKNSMIRNIQNQMNDLSNKLNQKAQEAQGYKRQHERYRHKSILYEEEINKQNEEIGKLSNNISSLTNKVNQLGLFIQQKNVQLKLRDNKHSQELQSYSQTLNKSEYNFNRQLDQARSHVINLAKELQKARKQFIQREEGYNQKISRQQVHIQGLQAQKNDISLALNRQISKSKSFEDKYLQQNKQNARLLRQTQTLRKKIEQIYLQKRTLEETYRREQKQFMQSSSRVNEQKWEQLNQKYVESNHKISQLLESKQNLEKTIYSLKNSLERTQIEKEQIRRCRTFESMITQIQTLCKRTIEKQGQISELKAVIANLEKQAKQTKKQVLSLHELIAKLVNMTNANQSNRREDNFLMIEQIKRLFIQHSIVMDQVKENTNKIAFNYQRHKEFLQSSQTHIVKSKEMQIEDLKDRLSLHTRQTQSKNELKQIINKIITITKQNTELKVTLNKQIAQIDQISKQCDALRQQLTRSNDIAKMNIRDKDEICKKLLLQLEESSSLLFEEKQNQLKLQSSLIVLEEQKDKNNKEVETRASIIKQLKDTIKAKEEYISGLNQKIEHMERGQIMHRQQLNKILESNTHLQLQNNEKQQTIYQLKARCEKAQQSLKAKDAQIEKNRKEMAQRLTQNNEQAFFQTSKLKSQLNTLISQNSDLKQELIRIGSSILSLTEVNQRLQSIDSKYNSQLVQIQNYKQQTRQLLEGIQQKEIFRYQLENSKNQTEHLRRQLDRHQRLMLGYTQKIHILEKELQRMQAIIEDFKVQNSTLQSSNYQFSLNIQKGKILQQKILVLSEEIDRLQRERVDFIEQLNVCRLQISQDCSLDRRVQENQLLLVLLFAQVESLRSLLSKKQQQFQDLRRANLR